MEETDNALQEFKSEYVTFTVERKPKCMVEYNAWATPDLVKNAREKALRSIAKEVSIPGFRKGRAPDHLIVRRFSALLDERWKKMSVDLIFQACQKVCFIPLLSDEQPKMTCNIKQHSVEEGAQVVYLFESEPVVPDIDFTMLELEEVKRETIDDEKIQTVLHEIQLFFAEWKQQFGRGAQMGDYVTIDLNLIEEDPSIVVFDHERFKISKETMAQWMIDLVIGMKIEESMEGVSRVDEGVPEKQVGALKDKKVQLILRKIEQPILPDIDDSLAQKLGAENIQELQSNLVKLCNKTADMRRQMAYRDQVNEYLLDACPFELPETLIADERNFRLTQLRRMINPTTKASDIDLQNIGKKNTIVQSIEEQGEKAVRLFFIAKKIAEEQKIQISFDAMQKEKKTDLELLLTAQSDLYLADAQSAENRSMALSRLILKKVDDHIISKVKIVPAKSKQEQEESEEDTTQDNV